jgi:hypothetical protein
MASSGRWLIKAATSAQDAAKLGIECGVPTIEGFKGVFRKFFGDEELYQPSQ